MRVLPLSLFLLVACPPSGSGTETDSGTGIDPGTDTTDVDTTDPDTTDVDTTDPDTTDVDTTDIDSGDNEDFPAIASSSLHNQSLSHSSGTCTSSAFDAVYPEEGMDHNNWAGVRLTPNSYPFEVDAISIELYGVFVEYGCRTSTARPVVVAKAANSETPTMRPSELTGVQSYTLMPMDFNQRTYIRKELDTAVTLNSGEDLWVMIQVESTSNGRTCIRGCQDDPQIENNWYSSNASEPLNWIRLDRFSGITATTNMLIEAYDLP